MIIQVQRLRLVCVFVQYFLRVFIYGYVTVRLWDVRAGQSTLTLDHGHPVEDTLVFPHGGLLVSAGGPVVKIWDVLSGGRLLHTIANHQKTVTQVCLDSQARRLLTASLDRHVKVFDTESYRVMHSMKYSESVRAMALSVRSRSLF